MLRIVNIEEIQNILSSLSKLTDLQQQRDSSFDKKVKLWLASLEQTLESNKLMQASEVATLRGVILSAENGVIPPGLEFHGRTSKRKIVEAAASFSLRKACNLVSNFLEKEVERVSNSERMMRQLLAVANTKGVIQQIPGGSDHTEVLKSIWRKLSSDPELTPGTTNVEGLVGPQDALIVLDRIIASDLRKQ